QARPAQPYEYFYYACRHHDPVETGRVQRCTGRRVRRNDLDAVVWDALVSWIQSPQLLVEEIAAWRTSRDGAGEVVRDLARLERVQRQTGLQIERLLDADRGADRALERRVPARRTQRRGAPGAARAARRHEWGGAGPRRGTGGAGDGSRAARSTGRGSRRLRRHPALGPRPPRLRRSSAARAASRGTRRHHRRPRGDRTCHPTVRSFCRFATTRSTSWPVPAVAAACAWSPPSRTPSSFARFSLTSGSRPPCRTSSTAVRPVRLELTSPAGAVCRVPSRPRCVRRPRLALTHARVAPLQRSAEPPGDRPGTLGGPIIRCVGTERRRVGRRDRRMAGR